MANIESLPNEILLLIFGNLSYADLKYSLPLVCSTFYSLIKTRTNNGKVDVTLFRDKPLPQDELTNIKTVRLHPAFKRDLIFAPNPRFPAYPPPHIIIELNPSHTIDQFNKQYPALLKKFFAANLCFYIHAFQTTGYDFIDGHNAVSPAFRKVTLFVEGISKKPVTVAPAIKTALKPFKKGERAVKYYDVITHIGIAVIGHARGLLAADKGGGLHTRYNCGGQMGSKGEGHRKADYIFKWHGGMSATVKDGAVHFRTKVEFIGKFA